ncbi:hypothetical protein [Pseudomonas cedrina]|uniref:hypothetical protein n=1 Tax=Pseudomonas cedrina TaxID=651740 RepID=UPI0011B1D127|nr:hypothetical protein [Pseudomonas cedrina]
MNSDNGFGVFVILCLVFIFLHQTGEDRKVAVRDIQSRQVELAQQKAQKEAYAKAAIAKRQAIANAEADCRDRKYIEGGKGAAIKITHYYDFFWVEKDVAVCKESISKRKIVGQGNEDFFYISDSETEKKAVDVQTYRF